MIPPRPAPAQPVAFNHKNHANAGVRCEDCHPLSGNGEQVSIPNVAQCVTCHSSAAKHLEIQTLAGLGNKDKTVSWSRVYELPSFVSFSHQKHLNAKIDCQVCHGAVNAQDALRQEKDISMMACTNCHKLRGASTSCGLCHNIGY